MNGGGVQISEFSSINQGFKSLTNTNKSQTSNSVIYFHKNQASKGGGPYLGFNSTVCTYTCLNRISFDRNSA